MAPVGHWRNVRVDGERLVGDFEPAPAGTTAIADDVRRLIDANILRATSVGFLGVKSEPIDPKRPYDGTRYTQQELLETSIVSVPANPAALQIAKSLNISDDTMNLAFGGHADIGRRRMAQTGGQAVTRPLSRAIPMTTQPLTKQIEDVQERRPRHVRDQRRQEGNFWRETREHGARRTVAQQVRMIAFCVAKSDEKGASDRCHGGVENEFLRAACYAERPTCS
jgi:hypothetical protein